MSDFFSVLVDISCKQVSPTSLNQKPNQYSHPLQTSAPKTTTNISHTFRNQNQAHAQGSHKPTHTHACQCLLEQTLNNSPRSLSTQFIRLSDRSPATNNNQSCFRGMVSTLCTTGKVHVGPWVVPLTPKGGEGLHVSKLTENCQPTCATLKRLMNYIPISELTCTCTCRSPDTNRVSIYQCILHLSSKKSHKVHYTIRLLPP